MDPILKFETVIEKDRPRHYFTYETIDSKFVIEIYDYYYWGHAKKADWEKFIDCLEKSKTENIHSLDFETKNGMVIFNSTVSCCGCDSSFMEFSLSNQKCITAFKNALDTFEFLHKEKLEKEKIMKEYRMDGSTLKQIIRDLENIDSLLEYYDEIKDEITMEELNDHSKYLLDCTFNLSSNHRRGIPSKILLFFDNTSHIFEVYIKINCILMKGVFETKNFPMETDISLFRTTLNKQFKYLWGDYWENLAYYAILYKILIGWYNSSGISSVNSEESRCAQFASANNLL